jgi:hypothetical protein
MTAELRRSVGDAGAGSTTRAVAREQREIFLDVQFKTAWHADKE